MGTSPGTDNLVGIGPLSGTSATVNLPTNGAPIYVQVQTAFSNGTAVFSGNYMYTEVQCHCGRDHQPDAWQHAAGGIDNLYLVGRHWWSDRILSLGGYIARR